jgi:hypothetical protein
LCLCGVGLPFLLIGLLAAIQMMRLLAAGVRTRAKVVGYETGAGADIPARYPVVEFRDEDGKVHRVQLGSGVAAAKGEETDIVYHPANPRLARGIGFSHTWLVPLAGIGVGGGLVALGVGALLGLRRKSRSACAMSRGTLIRSVSETGSMGSVVWI